MADTLCTKCRNPECEYAGRKVWVMICTHEYVAPPMTHFDQIKAMTAEELAEWISSGECPSHHGGHIDRESVYCSDLECKDCWLEWLKEEVKDE